jgi:hypothetical protein
VAASDPNLQVDNGPLYLEALWHIERYLRSHSKSLRDFEGMPFPIEEFRRFPEKGNPFIAQERNYDHAALERYAFSHVLFFELFFKFLTSLLPPFRFALENVPRLTQEQRVAYDTMLDAVLKEEPGFFFLDGPGGSGKTFTYAALLATVRARRNASGKFAGAIAIATASSGIAPTLLPGGRTAHSTFTIPLILDQRVPCFMSKHSARASLLKEARLIVWDECSMIHRHAFEAIDHLLRDIMNAPEVPLGGKCIVFGGDFRQILPVIPGASSAETIEMCIKASPLWTQVTTLCLSGNLRLLSNAGQYSPYLRSVGEGTHLLAAEIDSSSPDALPIRLPGSMVLQVARPMIADLIAAVSVPLAEAGVPAEEYYAERCILAPYVVDVATINDLMLGDNDPTIVKYLSADAIVDDNVGGTDLMPQEFCTCKIHQISHPIGYA